MAPVLDLHCSVAVMFFIICSTSPEVHPSRPSSKNFSCDFWLWLVCSLYETEVAQLGRTLWLWPHGLAHQAPLSMEFSRREYWSGLPFPFPGDLPDLGIEPWSPALKTDTFTIWTNREAQVYLRELIQNVRADAGIFSGENSITKGILASPLHDTVFFSQGEWDFSSLELQENLHGSFFPVPNFLSGSDFIKISSMCIFGKPLQILNKEQPGHP